MTELDDRCLDAFPEWLRALGNDARALAEVVGNPETPEPIRRPLAAALNYLFKSLDLIPDGIEDLGFIDDAFVLRVAARAAAQAGASEPDGALGRLAGQADLVREFLGDDFTRLESYVRALGTGSARGRSVDDILSDSAVCAELVREVKVWADGYAAPSFSRDDKNLVKLRSFLTAKLPRG